MTVDRDAMRIGPRRRWFRSLLDDSGGQDLIEYALLSALVGLIALAAMNQLGINIGTAYAACNTAVNALWESPPP